jgi:hypothetical protein
MDSGANYRMLPLEFAIVPGANLMLRMTAFIACLVSFAIPPAALWGQDDKALPLLFADEFAKGAERWQPTDAKAWRVVKTDRGAVYNQFQMSQYKPPVRSPHNISLIKDLKVTDFNLEAKVQSTGKDGPHRDMCLFFGYQAPDRFYYVHLAKRADDHANQIFIVNKADRKKISTKTTEGTPWDDGWHTVKVMRQNGDMQIQFDGKLVMTATDTTFAWGQLGLGSFDDSGNWADVKVYGKKFSD